MNERRQKRFLLISIIPQSVTDQQAYKDLSELKALVESYGGTVADIFTQHREVHDKGNYIGSGKTLDAAEMISYRNIDVVVLNALVKPGQIYDMKSVFIRKNKYIEVWDRIDLILQIFAKHANTTEARLQIELAAMRHMGPRIYGMGMELSRQTGGIGTRGIGETNTELMKRHWREQMHKVNDKLDTLARDRQRQLERRRRIGLPTVSLVGYTNAGKTSLFNLLTGKNKRVENALFVTLDSSVGKVLLPASKREILVSDTIGFIKNLPAELIDAFKSTLMESIYADVLLHVIDAADEDTDEKIDTVERILFDLGLDNKKRIYVFNKIDRIKKTRIAFLQNKYTYVPVSFISINENKGIEDLLTNIEKQLGISGVTEYPQKPLNTTEMY